MAAEQRDTDNKNDLLALLRNIQSEYSQLGELTEVESQHLKRLIAGVKVLQSAIERAIPLRTDVLGAVFGNVVSASLASDCIVVATREGGVIVSRPLAEFPSRIILEIIQDCAPEFNRLIADEKKEVYSRINLLEKALKELKKTESALKHPGRDAQIAGSQDEDIIRQTISTE